MLVLQTGIAGLHHHIEGNEDQERINSLTPGTELKLFREPENEYDEWAIAVYITDDDKLGYISRFKNETIARLMDAGKKFTAIVDDPEERVRQEDETGKKKRAAYTENMALPFSVYLVEME
ncbi:MAG: HIRAN domain-containing protein [Clostridia bacterium]|nr:HIRAN domain-containing protein [Clostridia bacterium]